MKSLKSYKQGSARIRRNWRAGRFAQALAEVDRLLTEWPDNPSLLVAQADLIQLQDSEDGVSLEHAKAAYLRAAELDSESPGPLVELGHYLYAIDDEAGAASKAYAKAIRMCKSLLTEALVGQAKALTELGRKTEALCCLAEAQWLRSGHEPGRNGKANGDIMQQFSETAENR
ncbi:MAG: hypothetical protein HY289_10230 [Planctomycetes bacterium]|nr:hypothetical protein [Planctomycetota bacterium]